ncbi:hypothetical protein CON94_19560 [Bacillus pseudomycoides]|nr:hypothetical protein CON94_19560 [Bacillus pseudomycoides]PEL80092.1 hypothetical protein CN615_24715 [Bacillus pseudomycoides]
MANYLTSCNIPTSRSALGAKNAGLKWQDSAVRVILKNPHYVGDLIQGREQTDDRDKIFLQKHGYKKRVRVSKEKQEIVHNTHDALISLEEFLEVQDKLSMRAGSFFVVEVKNHYLLV